ncbi:MAG: signal peptidase I [Actinobacteria bacterium]|nr:MAG: signal peptidase I [Actinomycetota bacterium]
MNQEPAGPYTHNLYDAGYYDHPDPSRAVPEDPSRPPIASDASHVQAAPQSPTWQPAPAPRSESDARLAAGQEPQQPQLEWWQQPPPAVEPQYSQASPQSPPFELVSDFAQDEPRERFSFWRWLWEAAVLVVLAFAIAFVIKAFVVQPFFIPSGSMEPTLMPGDRVLVSKFIYRFREPQAGDVVVFAAPNDSQDRDFIKRIVAVEGQTVEVRDGVLFVDGKQQKDNWASSQDHSSYGPLTLSDDNVFVMGDNRTNSSDSRVFGPFDRDRILGEAFVIYWPLNRLRSI